MKECRLSDGWGGGGAFPSLSADILGGGLIWGTTPVCRAGPILTHVKREGSRFDKSYSHMKTEWISRLNFFSRGSSYGPNPTDAAA